VEPLKAYPFGSQFEFWRSLGSIYKLVRNFNLKRKLCMYVFDFIVPLEPKLSPDLSQIPLQFVLYLNHSNFSFIISRIHTFNRLRHLLLLILTCVLPTHQCIKFAKRSINIGKEAFTLLFLQTSFTNGD